VKTFRHLAQFLGLKQGRHTSKSIAKARKEQQ
jgi:hypothetical protein